MNMAKASAKASPKRSNIENMYPLSPMQEGLLFHSLLSPTAGTYVPQIVLSFSGQLDGNLLQQAWEKAVTEHSILRTGFYWEQREQPFQVVYRQPAQAEKSWIEKSWIEQDWQQLSAVE
ncbi:MAG: condensation domain-containing protein, partial [Cyanobacteria bacterium J06576_12]